MSHNNLTPTVNPIDKTSVYAAVGFVSGAAVLFSCLTPVIIGAFAGELAFSESQLGDLFAVYNIGFTIIAVISMFFVRRVNWKTASVMASVLAVLALLAVTITRNYALILVIIGTLGLAKGALYAIGMAVMGDSDDPDKAFGLKMGLESIPSAIMLFLIPSLILPIAGFKGMFYALAAVIALLGFASIYLPARGVKGGGNLLAGTDGVQASSSLAMRLTALSGSIIFFAGIIATWAFLELVAGVKGFGPENMGLIFMAGFILSAIGGFAAAMIGGRWGRIAPLLGISLIALLALFVLSISATVPFFALGTCMLLFTVNFGLAYFFGLSAEIDLSGRFVVLSATSLSVGGIIGPAIAGRLMEGYSYQHVLGFSAACIILSLILYCIVVKKSALLGD